MEFLQSLPLLAGQLDSGQESLLITLIAAALFILIMGLRLIYADISDPVRRRLYRTLGRPMNHTGTIAMQITQILNVADPFITPHEAAERFEVEARLLFAGFKSPNSLKIFYAIKLLLIIGLPLLAWLLLPPMAGKKLMMALLMGAAAGFILPSVFLDKKIKERQKQLINGFPDTLDLLIVCTEAGLGLGMALHRVAQELTGIHPLLAAELQIVNAEISVGVERVEALYGLAKRTGLDEIRGLVGLLAQSITLGTSISEALRIYAEDFRDKRMQRAEEMAAKLGTKMIIPMVLCFFPGFFCIAVGPAVLKMAAVFGGN